MATLGQASSSLLNELQTIRPRAAQVQKVDAFALQLKSHLEHLENKVVAIGDQLRSMVADFSKPKDLTLVAQGGEHILVNTEVACRCPFFERAIGIGMEESTTKTVSMEDVQPGVLEIVVSALYTRPEHLKLPPLLSPDTLLSLMETCMRIMMPSLAAAVV